MHRGLYPKPLDCGFLGGVVSGIAAMGPRLTVMFLNGPEMHPPPLPAGLSPLLLCATFSPCPLMLVSLPSKMGEVSGEEAQRPQSQYCCNRVRCVFFENQERRKRAGGGAKRGRQESGRIRWAL